jgi:hypothetical protein
VSHRNRSLPEKRICLNALHPLPPDFVQHLQQLISPSAPAAPFKISIPQVQPAAPARKLSDGAPCLVQADKFFSCDSHAFNNRESAEPHAERHLRNFLRNAMAKSVRRFANFSPLRCRLALHSLGNVVEESTMQLSPFLTDNLS